MRGVISAEDLSSKSSPISHFPHSVSSLFCTFLNKGKEEESKIYLETKRNSQNHHTMMTAMMKQYDYKRTGNYYAMWNFDLAEAVIGIRL